MLLRVNFRKIHTYKISQEITRNSIPLLLMPIMKILLIEDDLAIADLLSETLSAQHYIVEVATDGQTGLSLATQCEYDLILLDLMLPKIDGIQLCRELRSQHYQKPILLLTAKDSSADIVSGLDAGADDYLIKPCDLSELLARIRALLRRETKIAPTLLTWGALQVNLTSAEVVYAEQSVALSPKEYNLLTLFLRNPQRTFSRSEIIDRLWSIDACPGEGTVTNLIKDLRRKLKTAGMQTDLLETVYGMGYRLKSSSSSVQTVLTRYQKTFATRIEQFEQAILSKNFNQSGAVQEAHKLAGALGSFGYEAGSEIARSIEHLLEAQIDRSQLTNLIAQLKQELAKPPTLTAPAVKPSHRAKVMLVDDDAMTLSALSNLLHPLGLEVTSLQHPEQFWQTLSKAQPDVLVMDLEMPNLNGAELCRGVRQTSEWRHLPILMVTAHTDETSIQAAFAAGADDFIRKSLIQPEFVPRILRRIDRSRLSAI